MRAAGLSMRARLLMLCGGVLALTVIAGVIVVASVATLRNDQNDQRRDTAALTDAGTLLARYTDEETGLRGFLLSDGNRDFLTPQLQAAAAIPALEAQLRAETRDHRQASRQAASLTAAAAVWTKQVMNRELSEAANGQLSTAQAYEAHGSGKLLFDQIRTAAIPLRMDLTAQFTAAGNDVHAATGRLQVTMAVALGVLIAMIVGLFAGLFGAVLVPLSALGADARRVASGHLDDPVNAAGPPEIQAVASDVEAMRRRLRQELREGLRSAEALNQQGPAVVALNGALAAAVAELPGLQVATARESAEGVLAGDWIDTVLVPEGRLGVVIGDVSGHGPRAAVLALRLKVMLAASLAAGASPGRALGWACQQLVGDDAEMFATVFAAVLDPTDGTLTYANAGHPEAFLFIPGEPPCSLSATGPLLSGMLATWAWGDQTVAYPPDAVLAAYTDGATEARDPDGHQFGTSRLLHYLGPMSDRDRSGAVPDLADALERTLDAIHRHTHQRLTDDCTFLTARRLSPT